VRPVAGPDPYEDAVLRTDSYLEALLAGAALRSTASAPAPDVDDDVARAAAVLHRSLVRFHPSFRFEERLAARLMATADGAHPPGRLIEFRTAAPSVGRAEVALPAERRARVLVGGAIASGVSIFSLAGAIVVRRRGRQASLAVPGLGRRGAG
jgi:hypothetical protein